MARMTEFFKMDVFFFVTTVMVAFAGVLLCLILWKIFQILQHVERFAQMAHEESALLREDIAEFRSHVKSQGFGLGLLWGFFRKLSKKSIERKR